MGTIKTMNASQRRKSKRVHPYDMVMIVNGQKHYYEFDNDVEVASKWCKKKCKGSFIINKNYYDKAVFKFANEKDAVIFGLKFL